MKMKSIVMIVLSVVFLFGCGRATPPNTPVGVVQEITVTREQYGNTTRQIYTDSEKQRRILNALRQLGQQYNPKTDPDTLPLLSFHIVISSSDGTKQIYRTKGDRYIRQGTAPWQETDSKSLSELCYLLQNMPGDVPKAEQRRDLPRNMDWLNRLRYPSPVNDA